MSARPPNLLIGVGQVLCRDDGIGVYVARAVAAAPHPPEWEVRDAGVLGLDAADLLEGRACVVIVDAIDAQAPPGAVLRMAPQGLAPGVRSGMSVHDFHLLDALEQTRLLGRAPQRVLVWGVQVADVSAGVGLSPPLASALPRIVERVRSELGLAPAMLPHESLDLPTTFLGAVA